MEAVAIAVTPEDLVYVRSSYVTLDELADGRRVDRSGPNVGGHGARAVGTRP